jgi:hypothetical protein
MAIVSYSQYHVNLVTLEKVKMLGSNFTFGLGRNPRGRRPLLHHAPSPLPANVGQSPPTAGGGGTRSPLRCGPAPSSQLELDLRSPPLAPKLPRPAWPSPSVHLPHAGLLPAPSPPHLHFAQFWQQVIRSRSKRLPVPLLMWATSARLL